MKTLNAKIIIENIKVPKTILLFVDEPHMAKDCIEGTILELEQGEKINLNKPFKDKKIKPGIYEVESKHKFYNPEENCFGISYSLRKVK